MCRRSRMICGRPRAACWNRKEKRVVWENSCSQVQVDFDAQSVQLSLSPRGFASQYEETKRAGFVVDPRPGLFTHTPHTAPNMHIHKLVSSFMPHAHGYTLVVYLHTHNYMHQAHAPSYHHHTHSHTRVKLKVAPSFWFLNINMPIFR